MFLVEELNLIDLTRYGFVCRWNSLSDSLCALKSGLKTARMGCDSDAAVYSILSFKFPKPQSHVPDGVLAVFPPIARMKPKEARDMQAMMVATTGMERAAKFFPLAFCNATASNGLEGWYCK